MLFSSIIEVETCWKLASVVGHVKFIVVCLLFMRLVLIVTASFSRLADVCVVEVMFSNLK